MCLLALLFSALSDRDCADLTLRCVSCVFCVVRVWPRSRNERFDDDVDEMRAFMSMFMELVGMFGSEIPTSSMPNGCGPGCNGGHVHVPPGESRDPKQAKVLVETDKRQPADLPRATHATAAAAAAITAEGYIAFCGGPERRIEVFTQKAAAVCVCEIM